MLHRDAFRFRLIWVGALLFGALPGCDLWSELFTGPSSSLSTEAAPHAESFHWESRQPTGEIASRFFRQGLYKISRGFSEETRVLSIDASPELIEVHTYERGLDTTVTSRRVVCDPGAKPREGSKGITAEDSAEGMEPKLVLPEGSEALAELPGCWLLPTSKVAVRGPGTLTVNGFSYDELNIAGIAGAMQTARQASYPSDARVTRILVRRFLPHSTGIRARIFATSPVFSGSIDTNSQGIPLK